jgi:hypothetical protein
MSDSMVDTLMKESEDEHDLNKCGICFDDFDDNDWTNKPYTLFPCGHTFCISCINRWV